MNDEFESDLDEVEHDPWDERDQFLDEHSDEGIQTDVHLLVPEEDGEDPLA